MKLAMQTKKSLVISSDELQAILVEYLTDKGINQEGYEIKIGNLPEEVSIELLNEWVELPVVTPNGDTEKVQSAEPQDDTISVMPERTVGKEDSLQLESQQDPSSSAWQELDAFKDTDIVNAHVPIVTEDIFCDDRTLTRVNDSNPFSLFE